MAADYYDADTENGDHIADPSEDALFMLIQELEQGENAFVTITPADGSDWYASVSLLDGGGYEVERRDCHHNLHEQATASDAAAIAHDLTIWLAARDYPDRPAHSRT
jgi:hypothetical protein